MSANNFQKILDTAIMSITNTLKNNYCNELDKVALSFQDSVKQKKMFKQKKYLEKQKKIIDDKLKKIDKEINELDPRLTDEDRELLLIKYPDLSLNTYMSVSNVKAKVKLYGTTIDTNRNEFDKISKRFINMMQLAVGSKEQRSILLNFYTLDWKSLWIDIPTDLNLKNIQIKNGKIIADTTLLLTKGK